MQFKNTLRQDWLSNYRADIDRLRAVAVLAVVINHLSASWVPGGYVGVDVFFVISGYLITAIIHREMAEDRFTFPGFSAGLPSQVCKASFLNIARLRARVLRRCGCARSNQPGGGIFPVTWPRVFDMNPISPLPIVFIFILALATTHVLARRFAVMLPGGRVSSIDGLRGFLALSAFINHGCVWFFYLRTGVWYADSRLYNHMGESAVALFFMITGFLFFSKLTNANKRPVDWNQLYIVRSLRLAPLYFFAMAVMFAIVAILSEGQLREPITLFALNAVRWLGFTVAGNPDLNGISQSWIIIAGVT